MQRERRQQNVVFTITTEGLETCHQTVVRNKTRTPTIAKDRASAGAVSLDDTDSINIPNLHSIISFVDIIHCQNLKGSCERNNDKDFHIFVLSDP